MAENPKAVCQNIQNTNGLNGVYVTKKIFFNLNPTIVFILFILYYLYIYVIYKFIE